MTDQPIAIFNGRPIYDNTPTVVAVLAFDGPQALVVRRNNEPGKGLLGLPGGYHMRGESWQEAGCREVFEETGWKFDPAGMILLSLVTDEYGNNLIIAANSRLIGFRGKRDPNEVQEVLWRSCAGEAHEWAFPRHFDAFRRHV